MLSRSTITAIVVSLSALWLAPAAVAGDNEIVILEFEPATLTNGVRREFFWIEDGILMQGNPSFGSASATNRTEFLPSNGTDFVDFLRGDDGATISVIDGSRFNAVSVDLAEYSTVVIDNGTQITEVEFMGIKPDGGFVHQAFALDFVIDGPGPLQDFEHFVFHEGFRNLTSLVIVSEGFSMDNLTLSIPSPAASVLSCIALGFGLSRRRR